MTTIHRTPPPGTAPFAIYEDPEDQEPPSPSEAYEGDVSFHSEISLPGVDDAIPSIENEGEAQEEPEPYNGAYTSRPSVLSSSSLSRRASGVTTTSFISSLPSEISISTKPVPPANGVESRYTPRKERPPFRNPSSVRAMQMSSPPPLPAYEHSRELLKGTYKLATPSRGSRSETVSTTGSRRKSRRGSLLQESQALQSPRPTPTPQQHFPLVLLHVTILPMQMPYAHDIMVKVMPDWLVENYKTLEEKLQDIVLMRRGVLIPHPREEYDVLEERILESLELKTPRLLKCGHFVGPEADADDHKEDEEDGLSVTDDGTGRGSRMSGGTITAEEEGEWKYPTPETDDESVCTDCHRHVKRPGKGVGTGTKRWDIKIYAANGLMRAGAWSAAWSEMERCDAEISPWIPNEVRQALERRLAEEHEAARRKQLYAAEVQRRVEEDAARRRQLEEEAEVRRRAEEAELQRRVQEEAIALQRRLEEEAAEKRILEETLNDKIEQAKEAIRLEFEAQALAEANAVADRFRGMEEALKRAQETPKIQSPSVEQHHLPEDFRTRARSRGRRHSPSRRPHIDEIPLGTLLWNYVLLLLRDQRNFIIILLGALVVFLSMNMNPAWSMQSALYQLSGDIVVDSLPPIPSIVVTSTATMTATSISTLTVTEHPPAESVQEALAASIATSIASTSAVLEAESAATSEEAAVTTIATAVSDVLEEAASPAASSETTSSSSPLSSPSLVATDFTQPVAESPLAPTALEPAAESLSATATPAQPEEMQPLVSVEDASSNEPSSTPVAFKEPTGTPDLGSADANTNTEEITEAPPDPHVIDEL